MCSDSLLALSKRCFGTRQKVVDGYLIGRGTDLSHLVSFAAEVWHI